MHLDYKKVKEIEKYKLDNELSQIKAIREQLKKYDMVDFVANVSALMLFPENQSKSAVFQCMISTALSIGKDEFCVENKMSYGKFKQIVNMFYNLDIKLMVDPPEFPFTLPIMYYKNYHVFMGNNSLSPLNVNAYLNVLSANSEKIDLHKYKELKRIINGLLEISEKVYMFLNLEPRDYKTFNKDNTIYVPAKIIIDAYKEQIVFDYDFINSLFGEMIENLKIEFGNVSESEITNFDDQKFYLSPFLVFDNKFVLVDITIILNLVMFNLLKYTTSISYDKFNFVSEYNKYLCFLLEVDFRRLGNFKISFESFDIKLMKTDNYCESLYSSGNDGVLINCLIFDDGRKYDFSKFDNNYTCPLGIDFISKRIKYLENKLIMHGIDKNKIFVVVTPNTIGRDMFYSLTECNMRNVLILSPYEINAISINESDKSKFLYRYLVARKRLKYYEKNLFSELNIIVLYINQNYSFYLGDDADTKDSLLFIIGEYSADYINNAYLKEDKHLCKSFIPHYYLEVVKNNNYIYYAPGLFYERQLNKVVVIDDFILWIISDRNINEDTYYIYNLFIDLISYWIVELKSFFESHRCVMTIKLSCTNKIRDFYNAKKTDKDISEILKYTISDNELNILITPDLYSYLEGTSNVKEKTLIRNILCILSTINDVFSIDDLKFENYFSNQYKQKTLTFNFKNEPYMVPVLDNNFIKISHSDENIILDDVGMFLLNEKKLVPGVLHNTRILNDVVEYLYIKLKTSLLEYNKESLIMFLYYEYEKVLYNLSARHKYYSNDVACYPENIDKINSNFNELNKTSVALKFVIELLSSLKSSGKKNTSEYDIEFLLAMASQIIEWAYSNDLFYYKMINTPLYLLGSNRLGFDREFINKSSFSLFKARTEKMGIEGKENRKRIMEFVDVSNSKEKYDFEKCFESEFGFSFKNYTEFTSFLLDSYSDELDEYNEIKSLSIEDIIENLKEKISCEIILKIIEKLSLKEREDFLCPPFPYRKEDVYPWRFNRELSFTRKPLIEMGKNIIWGYRTLSNSVYFLFDLINDGRLNAYSDDMKKYISDINNRNGKLFNDLVYNYISKNDKLIVKKNIKKVNKKNIADDAKNDLGDIDVLYIYEEKSMIVLVETKDFSMSKNFYEIYNEYTRMFDKTNPKSFINKHLKRVDWVKNHIDDFVIEYKLPNKKWKVYYMFIVDDYLVSKDVFKIHEKIITLSNLTEKDLIRF